MPALWKGVFDKMRGFRVWYKGEKRWLTSDEFRINANGEISTYGVYSNKSNLVRCDSTGLSDCHGKEIYEGDVVRGDSHHSITDPTSVVEWNPFPEMAGFQVASMFINIFDCESIEVIGNIYENKELIGLQPNSTIPI